MSKPCSHKTIYHHVEGAVWDPKPKMYLPPKPWTYICTRCTKKFLFDAKTSSLYGSMECEKCGFMDIEAVVCSEQCRIKYDDLLQVRSSESRAASRKRKAARDSVLAVREGCVQGEPLLAGANPGGGKVHLLPVQHPDRAPAYDAPAAAFRSEAQLTPTLNDHIHSAAELCRLNNWKIGTCLEGVETGPTTCVLLITAIGECWILGKCVLHNGKPRDEMETLWTLNCREWKEVPKPV
jgi:hypothetical protein